MVLTMRPRRIMLVLGVAALLLLALLMNAGTVATAHIFEWAGAVVAGLLVLWRWPHLKRHFGIGQRRARTRAPASSRQRMSPLRGSRLRSSTGPRRAGSRPLLGGSSRRAAGFGSRARRAVGRRAGTGSTGSGRVGRRRGAALGRLIPRRHGSTAGTGARSSSVPRFGRRAPRPLSSLLRRRARGPVAMTSPPRSRRRSSGVSLAKPRQGWRRLIPTRRSTPRGTRSRPAGSTRPRSRAATRATRPRYWRRFRRTRPGAYIRPGSRAASSARARRRWRIRLRRRVKPAAQQPVKQTPPRPHAGPRQRRPAAPARSAPITPGGIPPEFPPRAQPAKTGGHAMSGAAGLAHVSEAVEQHIGNFEPESGEDLIGWVSSLEQVFESQAAAFRKVSQHFAGDQPIDRAVHEYIEQLAHTAQGSGEISAEASRMLAVKHEVEKRRIEEPRPNERLWDVK